MYLLVTNVLTQVVVGWIPMVRPTQLWLAEITLNQSDELSFGISASTRFGVGNGATFLLDTTHVIRIYFRW
jgi:hypothetical protein